MTTKATHWITLGALVAFSIAGCGSTSPANTQPDGSISDSQPPDGTADALASSPAWKVQLSEVIADGDLTLNVGVEEDPFRFALDAKGMATTMFISQKGTQVANRLGKNRWQVTTLPWSDSVASGLLFDSDGSLFSMHGAQVHHRSLGGAWSRYLRVEADGRVWGATGLISSAAGQIFAPVYKPYCPEVGYVDRASWGSGEWKAHWHKGGCVPRLAVFNGMGHIVSRRSEAIYYRAGDGPVETIKYQNPSRLRLAVTASDQAAVAQPHVLFDSDDELVYATKRGGSWRTEVIERAPTNERCISTPTGAAERCDLDYVDLHPLGVVEFKPASGDRAMVLIGARHHVTATLTSDCREEPPHEPGLKPQTVCFWKRGSKRLEGHIELFERHGTTWSRSSLDAVPVRNVEAQIDATGRIHMMLYDAGSSPPSIGRYENDSDSVHVKVRYLQLARAAQR